MSDRPRRPLNPPHCARTVDRMDQLTLHDVLSSAISLVRTPSANIHDRIAAVDVLRVLSGKIAEEGDREIPRLVGLIYDHIHEVDIVEPLVSLLKQRVYFEHPSYGPLLRDIGRCAFEGGADTTLFRFVADLGSEVEYLDAAWIEHALTFAVCSRKRRVGYVLVALSSGPHEQMVRAFVRRDPAAIFALAPLPWVLESLVEIAEG